jgi:uncharacterized small protein (DUF1192 family)
LQRANPLDNEALALVRAQQKAFDQELTKLALAPLDRELQRVEAARQRAAGYLSPKHPKMVSLQDEIERLKAARAAMASDH